MSVTAPRLDALRRSGLLRDDTFAQFDQLTELASMLIGAPVSLLSMVDEDRQFFTSQHGLPADLASARETPIAQSVCATVVRTGEPLAIDGLAADPKWIDHPAHTQLDVAAYCGVPIRDREGNVLGSFCVIDDQERTWIPSDVDLLERFAAIVGDYVQTSYDHDALITDLQHRLLPPERPDLPWGTLQATYRPVPGTGVVGGDFFDWIMRHDGALDVIIGDVVGHGLVCTQAAAQLRAAYRAVLTEPDLELQEVVGRMSTACAELPDCAFAAVIVARIAEGGGSVDYVRAGASPVVTTSWGRGSVHDVVGGPPLGVGPWTTDHVHRVELEEGDSLLLFTDGLIERRDELLDVGLGRACANAVDVESLDEFIDRTCPPAEQQDDLAVVAFTRRAPST